MSGTQREKFFLDLNMNTCLGHRESYNLRVRHPFHLKRITLLMSLAINESGFAEEVKGFVFSCPDSSVPTIDRLLPF